MANPVELRFGQPQDYSAALRFGEEDDDGTISAVELAIAGTLPELGAAMQVRASVPAAIAGTLPQLGLQARVVAGVELAALGTLPELGLQLRIAPIAELAIAGTLPQLHMAMQVSASVPVAIAIALPELGLGSAIGYDSNTARPTVGRAHAQWQHGVTALAGAALPQQIARNGHAAMQAPWQQASISPHGVAHRLPGALQSAPLPTQAKHQDGTGLHAGQQLRHQDSARQRLHTSARTQEAHRTRHATDFRHQDGDHSKRASRVARWQEATSLQRPQGSHQQNARPAPRQWLARHQDASVPPIGITLRPTTTPKPPFVPDPRLRFGDAIIITPKRAYIVLNAITLTRLDNGAPLHAFGFTASLNDGSWTWQWSATLHESAEPHLGRQANGDPPELLASINGQPLRLTLERQRLNQEFLPQRRWQVSGRGRASILASPWAPTLSHGGQTEQRTAQQLAQEVLTINGVGIGWTVDWQLPDWTVPAGLWAVQGSYIDALTDIAGAVGAYIQPHPTDATLHIMPKYPLAPWEWGSLTPDYEIPLDAVQTLGTEFIDKPAYNGIYVGGVQAGVFGPVIRAGTVGDLQAPQVTHPLITDATAQRLRGLAELADTGKQRRVSLSMQVLPETGLIVPGQLLQIGSGSNAMRGLVRGTSIQWSAPNLRQNLELEVHT
ncbi:MAG: hypothetical protein PHX60_13335 [Giesbergeria sp.]|uniref:hypothetical protein n=1 Tax=Giesbergeria sp. TaxID=2818473 RepID=UPI002627F236|nr:hypothetical protein [Giesbergeria sp.]MDD2610643.1 hypothetical protein [Giesbergeria sp.]